MPDLSHYLRSDHAERELQDVLQQPTGVLLGVNTAAANALKDIGIESVFDLGTSWLFANAKAAAEAGRVGTPSGRLGLAPSDWLKPSASFESLEDIGALPLENLRGLTNPIATALKAALDLTTIRDFAFWPPRQVAHKLVTEALGTTSDPEEQQSEELRPRFGEYPTERVYYDTLVMLQMDESGERSPLHGPISLQPAVGRPVGFGKPAVGALLTYSQSWYAKGVTLGHMLHSLALAPGEATRIAVYDWSRRTRATAAETITEREQLDNATQHSRAMSEVTNAVAREFQQGGSMSSGWATSRSEADAWSSSSGFLQSVLGSSGSDSHTTQEATTETVARSTSWSVGNRSVLASMTQNVNDRTEQHASSVRNRRASAVREVSQSEHEEVSTRIVANYNHMHALTVQYYEVVQIYEVAAQLHRAERCLFVPFEVLDFSTSNAMEIVERFRGALVRGALTARARDLLIDETTMVSLVPTTKVRMASPQSALGKLLVSTEGDPSPPPAEPESSDGQHTWSVYDIGRISRVLDRSIVRPGSDALFFTDDTELLGLSFSGVNLSSVRLDRPGATATDNTFTVPADSAHVDLPPGIRLREIDAIFVARAANDTLHAGSMTLHCSYRGRHFRTPAIPLQLATGTAMQKVLSLQTDEVDREQELLAHLQANRAHYSQSVFGSLDSATLVMLLSQFTWNGKPLAEQVEPTAFTVAGNYLVLRAPVEEDEPSGIWDHLKDNPDPVAPSASLTRRRPVVVENRNNLTWGTLLDRRGIDFTVSNRRLVPVPTSGVFAEAVLGRSNSAEKLDITRFWNWQDSPIPLEPTEISPVATGSRATPEDLKPGALGAPVINIVNPTSLPDPAGLGASLGVLATANLFRDMSGLQGTQSIAEGALRETLTAATQAGQLASTNLKTEAEKAVAMGQIAADIAKSAMKIPSKDSTKGISGDGARINHGRDMDKRDVPGSSKEQSPSGGGSLPDGGSSPGSGGEPMMGPPGAGISGESSYEAAYADQAALGYAPGPIAAVARLVADAGGSVQPAVATPKVTYDRDKAVEYARKYWNKVCNDGFVVSKKAYQKVDLGTRFCHEFSTGNSCDNKTHKKDDSKQQEHALLPDGSTIQWKDLDDCTHFISCCIGEPSGKGFTQNETSGDLPIKYRQLGYPPKAPYGITRVSTMVQYLTSTKGWAEIKAEKRNDDTQIKNLTNGDLIAYFNTETNKYSHLALYLDAGKIACHSYARSDDKDCFWDNDWDLGRDKFTWTFIHFVV